MGAGCYYTLRENSQIRAYWVDCGGDMDEFTYQDEEQYIKDVLEMLPKVDLFASDSWAYYGELFKIVLEPTYYSDGIVIQLENQAVDDSMVGLQAHLYENVYNKIIRHINKYVDLRIATSGYTSATIGINQIK